jgi:hypothetical protein
MRVWDEWPHYFRGAEDVPDECAEDPGLEVRSRLIWVALGNDRKRSGPSYAKPAVLLKGRDEVFYPS